MFTKYEIAKPPKSYVTTKEVIGKEGKPYNTKTVVYIPVLTISACNQLILTRWLPEEERWEFYTKDGSPPVYWAAILVPDDCPPLRGYFQALDNQPKKDQNHE
jgi:hypothetical protein